jgi:hypothetical protein
MTRQLPEFVSYLPLAFSISPTIFGFLFAYGLGTKSRAKHCIAKYAYHGRHAQLITTLLGILIPVS